MTAPHEGECMLTIDKKQDFFLWDKRMLDQGFFIIFLLNGVERSDLV